MNGLFGFDLGLMFCRREAAPRETVIDLGGMKRAAIHTFFMRFPIDIKILDENHIVLKEWRNVLPWELIIPGIEYRYVVETKSTIETASTVAET